MGALLDEFKKELAVRQTEPGFDKDAFKTEFLAARGQERKPQPTRGLPQAESRGLIPDIVSSVGRGITGSAEMYLRAVRAFDPKGGNDIARDIATKGLAGLDKFVEKHPFLKPSKEAESGLRAALTQGTESFIESASAIFPGLAAGVTVPFAAPFIGAAGGAAIFGAAEKDRLESEVEEFIVRENLTEAQAADLREKGKTAAIKSALVEGGFELAANTLQVMTLGLFRPFKGVTKAAAKSTFSSLFKKPGSAVVRGSKAYLKTAATEVGTETAQEALETKFRRDIGITDMSSLNAAISVIPATLVTSLLFLGSAHGMNSLDRKRVKKGLEEAVNPDGTPANPKKRKKAVDAAVAVIAKAGVGKKGKQEAKLKAAALRDSAYQYIDAGLSIDMDTDFGVIEYVGQMAKAMGTGALDVQEVQKMADGIAEDNPALSRDLSSMAAAYRYENNVPDMGETAPEGSVEDLANTMINGGDIDPEAVQKGEDTTEDVEEGSTDKEIEFSVDEALGIGPEDLTVSFTEEDAAQAEEARAEELDVKVEEFKEKSDKQFEEQIKAEEPTGEAPVTTGLGEGEKPGAGLKETALLPNVQKGEGVGTGEAFTPRLKTPETVDVKGQKGFGFLDQEGVDAQDQLEADLKTVKDMFAFKDMITNEVGDIGDLSEIVTDADVASAVLDDLYADLEGFEEDKDSEFLRDGISFIERIHPTLEREKPDTKLLPNEQRGEGVGTGEAFKPVLAEKEEAATETALTSTEDIVAKIKTADEMEISDIPKGDIGKVQEGVTAKAKGKTLEEFTEALTEKEKNYLVWRKQTLASFVNKLFTPSRPIPKDITPAETARIVALDDFHKEINEKEEKPERVVPEEEVITPVPVPKEPTALQKGIEITTDEELGTMLDGMEPQTKKKRPVSTTEKKEGKKPKATTKELKEKTATGILSDATSSGVKGVDAAMKGVFKLFGGANIKTFPPTIDQETYAEAKPHFETAFKEFGNAGKSLKEFLQFMVNNFGSGIKPYLKNFVQEQRKGIEAPAEEPVKKEEPKAVDVGEPGEKPKKKEKKPKVEKVKRIRMKDVGEIVPGKRSQTLNLEQVKEDLKELETGNTNKDLNKILNRAIRAKIWPIEKADRPNATPGTLRYLTMIRDGAMGVNLYTAGKLGGVFSGTSKQRLESYAGVEDLPGDRKGYNKIAEEVAKYEHALNMLNAATATATTVQEAYDNIARLVGDEKVIEALDDKSKKMPSIGFNLSEEGKGIMGIFEWNNEQKVYRPTPFAEDEQVEKVKPKDLKRPRRGVDEMERENVSDHRKDNPNPSSQDFADKFGMENINFGNYVDSKSGRRHINLAWDSFHDLTQMLGIPIKAAAVRTPVAGYLHETGESKKGGSVEEGVPLSMGFGSHGRGRHAAHYAPFTHFINMTKNNGDGSLSHEWAHALDSVLSITDAGRRAIHDVVRALNVKYDIERAKAEVEEILTGNSYWTRRTDKTPIEVAKQFLESKWQRYVRVPTNYQENAEMLGDYWDRNEEKFARAFEAFTYDSLEGTSPYLVDSWVDGGTTTEENGYRSNPYPTGEERESFNRIFKHFTDGIEWTEDGVPSMKEGYELVTEKEEAIAQAEMQKMIDKLEEIFAAMHQGEASKDGLWWYEYTATQRAAMMQPKDINAYDDKFGDKGAVAYTEALLPDDILYYKLKAVTHDEDANKVYLKEKDDAKTREPGDILDTAGLEGEASLGEVETEDGEGAETGPSVPRSPTARTGEESDGSGQRGESGHAGIPSDGEGNADVDITAGGTARTEPQSGQDAVLGGGNYRITKSDRVGQGTLNEKFTNNIAAIRTLKEIEREGRDATREEQSVLVKYVGWGGMSKAFDAYAGEGWADKHEITKQTLTDEEFASARASTLSAFYTSPEVVTSVYEALQKFGVKGGRMLEPAVGTGNFLGLLPEVMIPTSQMSGVEMDSISARIAKQLYQNDTIFHSPYEKAQLPRNFYDVAISNVPFEDVIPFDRTYNKKRFRLHDYYFAKTLELVRPGGVIGFITSAGTMDKADAKARKLMENKADFIGAVRLPDTAFKDAGTKVTADIIFMRRKGGEAPTLPVQKWTEVKPYVQEEAGKGNETYYINEYFVNNPDMMLGQMNRAGRWETSQSLITDGRDIDEALKEAVGKLPSDIYTEQENIAQPDIADLIPEPDDVTDGGYFEQDGKLFIFVAGQPAIEYKEETTHQKRKGQVIREFIKLRGARRAMLKSQAKERPESEQKKLTKALNVAYDNFVKKFGFVNLPANLRAIIDDPEAPRVLALENWDDETGEATKSDIFSKKFIKNLKPITKVDKPTDAVPHSLNTLGRVDIPFIAKLAGTSEDEAIKELKGEIWNDPEKGWVVSDEYLSGNIKEKIALAEQAAKSDPIYKDNVEALTPLIPEDLPPSKIVANLGAPWVEPRDVQEFIRDLIPQAFGVHVDYVQELGKWKFTARGRTKKQGEEDFAAAKASVAATTTWGTSRKNFFDLLENITNGGMPTVRDPMGVNPQTGKTIYVVNPEATDAAQAKLEAIKEKFGRWLWEDADRQHKYVRKYNDVYNAERDRKWNGDHLTFPGQVPDDIVKLTKHQKDAVWRAISSGLNTYFGHEVGTGKTYVMAATIMEAKRLGLKKKPLLMGVKANIDALAEDFIKLYPAARVLRMDISGNALKRKIQLNRIANNEWDAVIITHDSFKNIQLSPAGQSEAMEEELGNLRIALAMAQESGAAQFTVKEIEKKVRALEAKQERLQADLNESKIDLDFEELGVDMIVVDEAHIFKNIPYATKHSNIVGISGDGSTGALDLHQKTRWINEKFGGGVIMASGTPITNSVAEIYNIGRYLNPQTLRNKGIHTFDAWAAAFGNITQTPEFAPEGGGYRMVRKFKEFVNIPELRSIVREVVDVVAAKDLNLKVPEILSGRPIPILIPQNEMQEALGQEMLMRARAIRSGGINHQPRHPEKIDIMLSVISDGRNGAIDMRLVDRDLPDAENTKVNAAARNIFQSWKASENIKGTQLVFADRGVPGLEPKRNANGEPIQKKDADGKPIFKTEKKRNKETGNMEVVTRLTESGALIPVQKPVYEMQPSFNIYDDLKNKLVAMGIPAEQIAFPRDLKGNKLKKKKLFRQINKGIVRVVIGSTENMGIGVNVQERGVALHNLDTEWTFEKLEQRRGRFIRQGNILFDIAEYFSGLLGKKKKGIKKGLPVAVFNYMTEGTVDAFMWDKVAAKKVTTEVVLFGNSEQRTVEDVSQESASAQEMMAIASGDPRFLHKIELETEVRKLKAVRGNWEDEKYRLTRELQGIPGQVEAMNDAINHRREGLEYFGEVNAVRIGDVLYDLKRHSKELNEKMAHILRPEMVKLAARSANNVPIATYGRARTEEIETEEEVTTVKTVKDIKALKKGVKLTQKGKKVKVNKVLRWEGNDIPIYVRGTGFTSGEFAAKTIDDLKIGTKTKYGEYEMTASGGLARLLSNTKAAMERESKESQEIIVKKLDQKEEIEKKVAEPFEKEQEHTDKTLELANLTAELGQILQQQQEAQSLIDPDLERFKASKAKDVGEMDAPEEDVKLSVEKKNKIKSKEKEYWTITEKIAQAVVDENNNLKDALEKERTKIQKEISDTKETPAKLRITKKTIPTDVMAEIYNELFDEAETILGKGKIDLVVTTQEQMLKDPKVLEAAEAVGISKKQLFEEHNIKGAYQGVVVDGVAVKGVIRVAADGIRSVIDMETTVRHEVFHGVFQRLLNNKDRAIILKKFGSEETASEAFADYVAGKGKLHPLTIRGIFERMMEFFERFGNLLKARGFTSAGDIFGAAAAGELIESQSNAAVDGDIRLSIEKGVPEEDLNNEHNKDKGDFSKILKSENPVFRQYAEGLKNVVTQNPANVQLNKTHSGVVDEIYANVRNTDIKFTQRVFGLPWFLGKKFVEWKQALGIELKRNEDRSMIISEFNKKVGEVKEGEKDQHEIMGLKKHEEEGVLLAVYEGDARGELFDEATLQKGIKMDILGQLDKKYKGKTVSLSPRQIAAYKAFQASTEKMKERMLEAIDRLIYLPYANEPWVEHLKANVKRHEKNRARQRKVETDQGKRTDFSELTEKELPPRMQKADQKKYIAAFKKILPKRVNIASLRRLMGEVVGYAPRVRQGKFVVATYDMDGNTIWSERSEKEKDTKGFIDSQIKRQQALGLKLGEDFTVRKEIRDKASEFIFDQIQAVSVERFVNKALNRAKTGEKISEADINAVSVEMINLLTDEFKGRGFGATMMNRKEGFPIGGYKIENIKRRYAEYVTGASGYITKQIAAFEYANLLRTINIEKKPDLYEDIAKYSGDMLRNSTRLDRISGRVRSAAFIWYLAGQFKSPVVNFTQNWILGIPLLEKAMGKGAKGLYHKAMADVARRKYTAQEKRFLTEMSERGITGDQLTQEITGQSVSESGKGLESVVKMLAIPFSLSEVYNRKVSGLARFRAAIAAGDNYQEAFDKSRDFIFDVHFLYGKLNAPSGARGGTPGAAIFRTSLTFRSYTFNFLTAMKNMLSERDFRTVAKSMTYMVLLGGASALPFLDGFLDMLERITGISWRKDVKKELENIGGEVLANVGIQGLPALIGADIGGSLRIHFPDVTQPGKLIEESVFGVYEGLAMKAVKSVQAASTGQIVRAFESAAPVFIERPLRAIREREGLTTIKGRPIKDPTGRQVVPSVSESVISGLSFRPSRIARLSDNYRQFGNIKKFYSDWRSSIYTDFRLASTFDGRAIVLQEVQEYNRSAIDQGGAVPLIRMQQLKAALKERVDKRLAAFSR